MGLPVTAEPWTKEETWHRLLFPGVSKKQMQEAWDEDPQWQAFAHALKKLPPHERAAELSTYLRDHSRPGRDPGTLLTPARLQAQFNAYILTRSPWSSSST